jgi:23S rRNA pseudouridine2605 synthase
MERCLIWSWGARFLATSIQILPHYSPFPDFPRRPWYLCRMMNKRTTTKHTSAPKAGPKSAPKTGLKPAPKAGSKTASTSDGVRLNKVIADSGVASRRAADEIIREGRVKINGKVVTELGTRVQGNDKVAIDNKQISDPPRHSYILLNKPKDTITTTSDERGRRTVLDLVEYHDRIYPVGRLDRNTTGVLLLTNDGDLSHRLMHPRYGVERLYDVELDKPLENRHARKIAAGVTFENGEETQPCELFVEERDARVLSIQLREGKNREVRRLFEEFGYTVVRLHRSQYAGLTVRGLARGEWRPLDRREISALRRLVKLHDDV